MFIIPHARISKVRDSEDVLKRMMRLVCSGGWLLADDADTVDLTDRNGVLGPGLSTCLKLWQSLLQSRGADPSIGRRLESILRSVGCFSEVNVKKVSISLSEQSSGAQDHVLTLCANLTCTKLTKPSVPSVAHGRTLSRVQFRSYHYVSPRSDSQIMWLSDTLPSSMSLLAILLLPCILLGHANCNAVDHP